MLNTNKEVNAKIGDMFMDDSNSFLTRYSLLIETATEMGRRCKLLVDIRFAIECALKALIFYESNYDEKKTYGRVKVRGHSLEKLLCAPEVCKYPIFQQYFAEIKDLKLDEYNVELRYSLETYIQFGPFDKKSDYYTLVENLLVNNKIFDIAQKIYKEVEKIHTASLTSISLGDINLDKEEELEQRIIAIRPAKQPMKQPLCKRILIWLQQLWQKVCCFWKRFFCKKLKHKRK